MPPADLSGAYGVVAPPPAVLRRAPARAIRYLHIQRLLWVARIGVVGGLLTLLYLEHVIYL